MTKNKILLIFALAHNFDQIAASRLNGRQTKHFSKRNLKLVIAQWIQNGIASRIDVAEPDTERRHMLGYAVRTKGHHQENKKVRHPEAQKSQQQKAQLPSGAYLMLETRRHAVLLD